MHGAQGNSSRTTFCNCPYGPVRRGSVGPKTATTGLSVAAAMDKPVVAVFGPTDPRRTGPYGQLQNVVRLELPCAPCMKSSCNYFKPLECLRAISAENVFGRVVEKLDLGAR